jgi:hypothetical protein
MPYNIDIRPTSVGIVPSRALEAMLIEVLDKSLPSSVGKPPVSWLL